jgi:hypothetical protein
VRESRNLLSNEIDHSEGTTMKRGLHRTSKCAIYTGNSTPPISISLFSFGSRRLSTELLSVYLQGLHHRIPNSSTIEKPLFRLPDFNSGLFQSSSFQHNRVHTRSRHPPLCSFLLVIPLLYPPTILPSQLISFFLFFSYFK